MDVIALGKAKKAKAAIQKLNERLGDGVADVHDTVKVRLEELEKQAPSEILNKRLSDMERHTHINMNKHNLRISMITKQNRYKMNHLIFDDLSDLSGVNTSKSTGILHSAANHTIGIASGSEQAEVVFLKEKTSGMPKYFTVSQLNNLINIDSVEIGLAEGVSEGVNLLEGALQLAAEGDHYRKEGSYETAVTDLGDNVKTVLHLEWEATVPEGASLDVDLAWSKDGITFTDYAPINPDGSHTYQVDRYVKAKLTLRSKLGEAGFPLATDQYENEKIQSVGTQFSLVGNSGEGLSRPFFFAGTLTEGFQATDSNKITLFPTWV
jgi:hypothetical protein